MIFLSDEQFVRQLKQWIREGRACSRGNLWTESVVSLIFNGRRVVVERWLPPRTERITVVVDGIYTGRDDIVSKKLFDEMWEYMPEGAPIVPVKEPQDGSPD